VNKNKKPNTHIWIGEKFIGAPNILANQLKILMPVGTAIIIVALVKYARVSKSMPTVNM
jgi:hypothetical protein